MQRWLERAAHRLVARLAWRWKRTRTLYQVLLLVRFSLLLGVLCGLVLLINDQAQEILRRLGEDHDPWAVLLFTLAALSCAVVAWYASRVMFFFQFDNPASDPACFPRLKRRLPRLLGVGALLLTAIALLKAAWGYPTWLAGPGIWLATLALIFILLGALFYYLTARRLDLLQKGVDRHRALRRVFGAGVRARPERLRSLGELPRSSKLWLLGVGAAGFALMILLAFQAHWIAAYLGAGTIAFLAAASLIPTGSLLVYAGNKYNLPVISAVLVWVVLLSYWVDNHRVRQTAEMRSSAEPSLDVALLEPVPALAGISSLQDYFERWIAGLDAADPGGPAIPVIIVSTEGGGIRAAYWTALVLGELQDRVARALGPDRPGFARHVFGISGVSGGSLGSATFAALMAGEATGSTLRDADRCRALAGSIRRRGEHVLAQDFLAPTVAVMLFPDLFQRFFPVAVLNDRAVALERAWETAWNDCETGERFGAPFQDLWSGPSRFRVPLLFLNSTVVETGQRMIASPIVFSRKAFELTFADALETERELGRAAPLSTIADTSARFTYVSPAGSVRRLPRDDGTLPDPRWIRVVDGGYFENSGAVTAAEILRAVEVAAGLSGISGTYRRPVRPVVIHISNDPLTRENPKNGKHKLLGEALSPLRALLNVRPARGYQARAALARQVRDAGAGVGLGASAIARPGYYLHFRLCDYEDTLLPLGWTLSLDARDEMAAQLSDAMAAERGRPPRPIARYHEAAIAWLVDLLSGRRGDTAPPPVPPAGYADCGPSGYGS
ncbi:MAG: hypothetical protein ACREH6_14385 [Geminicoccaceae bacterium]